jgi:hypothetical protein
MGRGGGEGHVPSLMIAAVEREVSKLRRERRFPPRAGGKRRRPASHPWLGPEHGPSQPAAERYLRYTRGQRIVTRLT